LYAKVAPAAKQEGVIDAAIWVGYAWADEPRNHAVVMVTGDDKQKVSAAAEELANSFWQVRSEFEFVAPTARLTSVWTWPLPAKSTLLSSAIWETTRLPEARVM
jgi:microcystin degradation protein MlrC